MTVECTFGILSAQWRLYRRVIGTSAQTAERSVKATCVLHNYLRWHKRGQAIVPTAEVDSPALQPIGRVGCNNAARAALDVRHSFAQYFSAEGAVPWQVHDA